MTHSNQPAHTTVSRLRRAALGLLGLLLAGGLIAAILGTGDSLGTVLGIFSTRFLGIFIEAVPFLLLGTVISGLIDAFVTPEDIAAMAIFLASSAGARISGQALSVCGNVETLG